MSDLKPNFQTFSEFYPYYLREHSHPKCRTLHFVGTFLSLVAIVLGALSSLLWFIAAPIFGYAFAWAAHAFIERNKPATFTYPVWSLIGDYRMFWSWLTGSLSSQLEKAGVNPKAGF